MENLGTRNLKSVFWILASCAVAMYANTLQNGYVLDDDGLLINNTLTESGWSAIKHVFSEGYRSTLTYHDLELYRPLPRLFFVIYWTLFPGNPLIPHLVNVMLFAVTVLLLFRLLYTIFELPFLTAFLSTLLFTVHPIHTEVVANAKSLDEILSLLLSLAGGYCVYQFLRTSHPRWLLFLILAFALSILSKENAIVTSLVLTSFVLIKHPSSHRTKGVLGLGVMIALAVPLLMRFQAIGFKAQPIELSTNFLSGINSPLERLLMSLGVLSVYLQKLLLPIHLTCDASYHSFSNYSDFVLSITLVALGLGLYIWETRQPSTFKYILHFSGAWTLLNLIPFSNLFFLIGTDYAERLTYTPSIGMCVLLVYLLSNLSKTTKSVQLWGYGINQTAAYILGFVFLLFFGLGVARNNDWKTNLTLFEADIATSPNSARLQAYYANALYLQAEKHPSYVNTALAAYQEALHIYPNFAEVHHSLGILYGQLGDSTQAIQHLKQAISIKPNQFTFYNNLGDVLYKTNRLQEAEQVIRTAIKLNPSFAPAFNNMGSVYATKAKLLITDELIDGKIPPRFKNPAINGLLDSALWYYSQAQALDDQFADSFRYAAIIWRLKQEPSKADSCEVEYEKRKSAIEKRAKVLKRWGTKQ